jgi:hypothetical protein
MLLAWEATQIKKWKSEKVPSLLGKQRQVGQYSLYIRAVFGYFDIPKKFIRPKNFFGPLKWYTVRNFFGDGGGGGGGGSPKKFFFGSSRAQSEKVGQISFCPPNFFLPVRPCRYWQAKLCAHEYSDVLLRFLSVMHHDTSGENFLWKRAWTKKVCIQSYFEVSNMMKPRDSM